MPALKQRGRPKAEVRRGPGRPKGSKNKVAEVPARRGPGRPKGSVNRPRVAPVLKRGRRPTFEGQETIVRSFPLPVSTAERLANKARDMGVPMNLVVDQALTAYLSRRVG